MYCRRFEKNHLIIGEVAKLSLVVIKYGKTRRLRSRFWFFLAETVNISERNAFHEYTYVAYIYVYNLQYFLVALCCRQPSMLRTTIFPSNTHCAWIT